MLVALAIAFSINAEAASLPQIKASERNRVPECATPGRLTAYLRSRNPEMDKRFEAVATEYMRHGEVLGLRWDYAFYQMIVETGSLKFRNGNGRGDVSPSQNNFAGIGATGKGAPGESFKDIPTGVLAHLQHLMLYAGQTIDNPVAERTRKVQEWKIVHPWAQKLGRPVTYTDLGGKWAANDYKYGDTIKSVEEKFTAELCNQPDPRPELVKEARKGRKTNVAAEAAPAEPASKVSGADLAKNAMERARAEESAQRSGLGAQALAKSADAFNQGPAATADLAKPQAGGGALNVLNAPKAEAEATKLERPAFVTASAAAALAQLKPATAPSASAPSNMKCRVWTASYGGQKTIIIKAVADQHINYTVLDVNEGAERREAEAYIAAYAKGGQQVGEFASQTQALDKAFDLCPEG